jgi:hypothetical protein
VAPGSTSGVVPTIGAVVVAAVAPATEKKRASAPVIDALDLPQIIHSRA